jgi:hypothetical protein
MIGVLAALVLLSLVVFGGAHLALLGALVVRTPRYRALVAFAVPPLAPYWAWQGGAKGRVYVWGVALTVYTAGVALLRR